MISKLISSQQEHKNAAGRPYWFNPSSKESVWEKPDGELI
jgi:hypothetical protein